MNAVNTCMKGYIRDPSGNRQAADANGGSFFSKAAILYKIGIENIRRFDYNIKDMLLPDFRAADGRYRRAACHFVTEKGESKYEI